MRSASSPRSRAGSESCAVLSAEQRRLYARQVLLRELGPAGQARLCESVVTVDSEGDARAAAVSRDYLQRAGLQVRSAADATASELRVELPSAERVEQLAGDPALAECAAWLLGAWTAVETIKRCAELGSPAQLDESFTLNPDALERRASEIV